MEKGDDNEEEDEVEVLLKANAVNEEREIN